MTASLDEIRRDPSRTPNNLWRRETPGAVGWRRSVHAGAANKYFMFSADCHAVEPSAYLEGIEPEYRARIPRMELREDGSEWLISEGNRPQRVKPARKHAAGNPATQGLPAAVPGARMDDEDVLRNSTGRTVAERLAAHDADGIDAELMFPNKGLLCWASPDPVFAMAMCRQWNRWARDFCGEHMLGDAPRILPTALLACGDQPGALREIRWAADHGFRAVCLGNSVKYGPKHFGELEYNDPSFEPMWALLEETGLVVTFHVSTGRDPRASSGPGGAVINYAVHCCAASQEPVANLCASGVLERHPKLRFATIEAGIGWVPWLLEAMDEAFYKHRMWVSPELKEPPSFYYRRQGFSSFGEDRSGLALALEHDLVDSFMWANDYPHHEGTWPHSAAAIERTMGALSDEQRAKILGGNAARLFGIERPGGR